MGILAAILAASYGAAAGLLLPRAAYRLSVPPETPWRAHCPDGHPIPGWLGSARCGPDRRRGHRYGPTRLGAATAAAVTAAACAALAAAGAPRPEAAVFVALAPVLVLLALVDLAVHRLPDVLTLPLAAATAGLLGCAALLPGAAGSWRLALLGGGALGAAYLVLFLINPAGMGLGDVKLALPLGVALGWYGWGVWTAGAFLGFLYGALYGLGLLLSGRATRKQGFAFGPFMAAGALTGVLLGGFGA
ncbi:MULTISPECIES: A24 family peptidase [unclassified Streptomyces]|uniref:A24 family peptidase n=1 Tax=unclassified Streptomyces TaxID=2593676 RepID=UPI0029B3CBDE|nr:A24 family peptidase [Streptomyces sp. DK15]MDX2389756.1 A24 family peptidase [Streptomyces sp. DK15]